MNDKTDKYMQRVAKALALLRQKVEAVSEAVENISSLTDLPEAKAKSVEAQLWDIFAYGEYYVEKLVSDLDDSILRTSAPDLFNAFYKKEYKPLVGRIWELIPDVEHAPERELVEWTVVFIAKEKDEPFTRSEIDDHMDTYEWYVSNGYVRDDAMSGKEMAAMIARDFQVPAESHVSSKSQNISLVSASEKKQDVKNVFEQVGEATENYVYGMLEDDPELKELWVERTDLPLYQKIISKPYFKPDDWVENQEDLFPIIVSRDLKKIPVPILARVQEIYESYIFSNWMAVIALSRSLLEYALVDEQSLVKIENLYVDDEKREYRNLWELIADAKKVNPKLMTSELAKSMTRIKDLANQRVMHPPRPSGRSLADVRWIPARQKEAKECIGKIFEIITVLYGSQPRSKNPHYRPR